MKALLSLLLVSSVAYAEPANVAALEPAETPAVDAPAPAPSAKKPRRFYFRLGGVHIAPLASSREMELADVNGPASLAIQNGPIAGSGATITSATVPGAIVGYVLPWANRKLSVEAVLGIPFEVHFEATGTLRDESIAPDALGIPTGVGPLGPELGTATAIPIVVTLAYAPLGVDRRIAPLVGIGPSILFAKDGEITNPTLTEVGKPSFDISPAPGLVLQGGLDVTIYKRIKARLDIKYIAGMLARATVEHVQVRTPGLPLFETVEVGTAKMSVWVNPLVVQLGIGADF
ncbi:MAG: OmpW family outer membrane protein [Kofleriaceae bacterium]